jgi:hypothetical protein
MSDITGALSDLIEKKKKSKDLHLEVIERVTEALNSTKGQQLALKLKRKDDFTHIIYQGLLDNAWGRITSGKIFVYNARLQRLLAVHPATKDVLEG